jgi:hypothetical protein
MEAATHGVHAVLNALELETDVETALLKFVRQLEADYAAAQDITLFVFAVRTFFVWHRAPELGEKPEAVSRIREAWVRQNEEIYTQWLSSMEDNPESLKWAKWTFQAKMSIFAEFLEELRTAAAGATAS